jgi:hypothetical protein
MKIAQNIMKQIIRTIKNSALFSATLFLMIAVYNTPAYGSTNQPIPAGCPGSTLHGPPAPGVCESIPAGCPGSTAPNPSGDRPPSCPYHSDDEPEGKYKVSNGAKPCKGDDEGNLTAENCGILDTLLKLINGLSAVVGIVVVLVLIVGGIRYSAASDNPQATSDAKRMIRNAIFAMVMFIFMFAFLQWLIPGGVFN